jgi:hypothetical protein
MKLNSWKNIFTFLFLYNVDINVFILFVEIDKNISVAKPFWVVYIFMVCFLRIWF